MYALLILAILSVLAYGWWQAWPVVRIMAWPVFVIICGIAIACVLEGFVSLGLIDHTSSLIYTAWPVAIVAGWFVSGVPIYIRRWQAKRAATRRFAVYSPQLSHFRSAND